MTRDPQNDADAIFRRIPFAFLLLLLLIALISPAVLLAVPNPLIVGSARFTVITPNCIRLEYSPAGASEFVDKPSIFAIHRDARWSGSRVSTSANSTVIDTGAIRLTYTPDGSPFSAANLKADIRTATGMSRWTPGLDDPENLGGTITTLDGATGPEDLGKGLLSRSGWAMVDDSGSPLLTPTWVRARQASSDYTDWYLFGYGLDYSAALRSLAAISGNVPMPRKYALGVWYSRYWPYSAADYHQIVDGYSQHDFPLDNIVMDMDWHLDNDWTGWTWNPKWIPDPQGLLSWFHSRGLHATINLHPSDGVGPWESQYAAFMHGLGQDPASGKMIPFDAGDPAYMNDLFTNVLDPLRRDGIDFWWLDWQQEPDTRSIPTLSNLFWLNTLLYNYTAQDGRRGMSFSRWAGWGDQRHPIHFSGDADTGFPMLAFEVPFTSTAGNVGCFFWSHDIGGHRGGRNEESYARWCQFGATSPVLRAHSTRDVYTDRRPWLYPQWASQSMRVSLHMRSEIFPYIYSSAWESSQNTEPLDRPMYFAYPGDEWAYHNAQEYLFGDNLLVAPIVTPGVGPGRVSTQTVRFPRGEWYDYFTGERYAGDAENLIAGDIDEFPLFVRGGVPVPMQPYRRRMGTAPLTILRVRCYPGAVGRTGSYTLYEDDGVTSDYTRGRFATTRLDYVRTGTSVTVKIEPAVGTYAGQPAYRELVIELPDTARAKVATVDGHLDARPTYDRDTFTNTIEIPARSIRLETTVTLTTVPAGFLQLRERATGQRVAAILGSPSRGITAVLADPKTAALPVALRSALLSVAGIGSAAKNQGAYLYQGKILREFFAPQGSVDGDRFRVFGSRTTTYQADGKPVDVSGPDYIRRKVVYPTDEKVSFSIHGVAYSVGGVPPYVTNPLLSPDNVAGTATVTASHWESSYSPEATVDGVIGGYPSDNDAEWSSGQKTGAWLRLDWAAPQRVDRVVLWDRPNLDDQVVAGILEFSDGTTEPVGTLPNDASSGFTVKFPAKTITWLKFTVTGVSPRTQNIGLSEIAVFRAK